MADVIWMVEKIRRFRSRTIADNITIFQDNVMEKLKWVMHHLTDAMTRYYRRQAMVVLRCII